MGRFPAAKGRPTGAGANEGKNEIWVWRAIPNWGRDMKKPIQVASFIFVILLASFLIGWWILAGRKSSVEVSRGQVLYEKHCSVCHGLTGDGQGDAAYLLNPKPRKFRAGNFRLVTSKNLQPTHEDLLRTITQGMPGTAMPSWAHLPENDRRELADYILQLNRKGWVDKGLSLGDTRAEAEKYADEMVQPGDPIPVPPEPRQTAQGLRQGRRYYLTVCAKCHGDNGAGKSDPTWRTSEGFPISSRNLREGVFKGGREGEQLYLRFFTGLPGTPMPAGELPGEQVWRVVQYIQSLSDPEAQERAHIRPVELTASRVPQLPSSPDDAIWEAVPEVRIPLMPLWWRAGYTDAVRVKAVHDGRSVAFCLEWNDDTRDIGAIHQTSFPDGAAVQLTASASPPLFAMGAAAEPVNIWHWKAVWEEDARQFQDVGTTFPGMVSDLYLDGEAGWQTAPGAAPRYFTAADARNLIASQQRPSVVEDANAAGFGTLTSQSPRSQNVQGLSRWKDGRWRLQLIRQLNVEDAKDIPLRVGQNTSVAFAVWDGSAGDRDGQKSVSIWSTLRLEP